jgi:hypothetical protein
LWSFFKGRLGGWISLSNERTRLSPAEAQIAKQSLALANSQLHTMHLIQMMGQQLAVPEVLLMA